MSKRFLFIIDPLISLNPKTDTTLALIDHAFRLNHEIFICEINNIILRQNLVWFKSQKIQNLGSYPNNLPKSESQNHFLSADNLDIICMRKDPPVDTRFVTALMMLRCYNKTRTKIFNNPDGLLCANEKLLGLNIAPQFFPKTLVSQDKKILHDFLETEKKVVIKPLFDAGGSGVMVFDTQDKNFSAAVELLTCNYSSQIIIQKYISEATQGDKRILLLGQDILGAVLRRPNRGDHRSNFHAGGLPQETKITHKEHEIIKFLGPKLISMGLHFVGLDIIGGYLTEINITSPTCLLEMENFLPSSRKHELREKIINYMIKHVD